MTLTPLVDVYSFHEYELVGLDGHRQSAAEEEEQAAMTDLTPDFEQIANRIVGRIDVRARGGGNSMPEIAWAAEQLRQVWNARGAADAKAVDDRLATLTGWVTSEPYRQHLRDAIAELDREPTKP